MMFTISGFNFIIVILRGLERRKRIRGRLTWLERPFGSKTETVFLR